LPNARWQTDRWGRLHAAGKAPPDIPALKPYWGKPAVRNFRGGPWKRRHHSKPDSRHGPTRQGHARRSSCGHGCSEWRPSHIVAATRWPASPLHGRRLNVRPAVNHLHGLTRAEVRRRSHLQSDSVQVNHCRNFTRLCPVVNWQRALTQSQ
jgi:hypothetical protein